MTLPTDAPSKSTSSQPLQRDPAKGKGPAEENGRNRQVECFDVWSKRALCN